VTTLEPTDESWELGDRELVCMVQEPTGRSPDRWRAPTADPEPRATTHSRPPAIPSHLMLEAGSRVMRTVAQVS